jgi:hypothetical protein
MGELKHFSLVKPTIQTPFHIDFEWWKQHDNNWRVFLHSYLCPEHQTLFANLEADDLEDYVDPETGEIFQVDGLQQKLIFHCSKQEGFIDEHTALVDGIFRVLLANGNNPMTPSELGALLKKPGDTILRTLTGQQIFMGIRPVNR